MNGYVALKENHIKINVHIKKRRKTSNNLILYLHKLVKKKKEHKEHNTFVISGQNKVVKSRAEINERVENKSNCRYFLKK